MTSARKRLWFTASHLPLHSFQDETWPVKLPPEAKVAAAVAKAAMPDSAPSEDEARAYEDLAKQVLGQAAAQKPPEGQVTRVEQSGKALAFLIESPEPIDWQRTTLKIDHAPRQVQRPERPHGVKLTDVSFGATEPNQESVTLLLR